METEDVVGGVVPRPHQVPAAIVEGVAGPRHRETQIVLLAESEKYILH